MSKGGGGTAITSVAAHVKDSNMLLLLGSTDGSATGDWDSTVYRGGSYRYNPSAHRYLLERGLTERGGNPYEDVDAFNPEEKLDAVQDAFNDFKDDVDALTPASDWATYLSQALSDGNTTLGGVEIDSVFANSMSKAVTEAATAIAAAFTDSGDTETLLTTASTAGGTITALAAAVADTEAQDSIEAGRGVASTLLPIMETTVSAETEDIMDNAAARAAALLPGMESIASSEAEDIINKAIVVAEGAVSNAVVLSMVTAYESRALTTHLRDVNRFAGGMADINAVNSSAFVIGMSMKGSDFTRDVNEFQARIEAILYEKGFDAFIGTAAETMKAYKDIVNSYLSTSAESMRIYNSVVGLFVGLAKDYLAQYTDVMRLRVGLYLDRAKDHGQTFRGLALEHVRATMQSTDLVYRGAASIKDDYSKVIESRRAATGLLSEINRVYIVAKGEEQQANFEYDSRYATWDLELFQATADISSAVAGAIVGNVLKPTRSQSALGGALAGASVGFAVGGPPGAVVGGVAGLIAGYQQ